MKRRIPTILILMVMVLVGAMYWVDLTYHTDPATGFILRGEVWWRYAVVALPIVMCLLGLRTVGPRAIAVLRTKNSALGGVMLASAVFGVGYGAARLLTGVAVSDGYSLVLGALCVWYGVWMFLSAVQLFTQNTPSPTKSAVCGLVASFPFVAITVNRILLHPSSLYRVAPVVSAVSALLAIQWFGLLLRSLYISLPRRRVRWMYLAGVFSFLFSTCLELPHSIYLAMVGKATGMDVFEAIFMAVFGLVGGCVSMAIAGQSAEQESMDVPLLHRKPGI